MGCKVIAFDLNRAGLNNTISADSRVQGDAVTLPFGDNVFDLINLSGVMTALTDRDPHKAQELRKDVVCEVFRCLNGGGVVAVSDCSRTTHASGFQTNFEGHAMVTGELGTIAVFKDEAKIIMEGLTPNQIGERVKMEDIVRFAHYYEPKELIRLFESAGFNILQCVIEPGIRPSGSPMDAIILIAQK